MAKDIWAAFVSFCICLYRCCLLCLLSAEVSWLIRLCNDIRAFGDTGVISVCSTSSGGQGTSSLKHVGASKGKSSIFLRQDTWKYSPADKIFTAAARGWHYDEVYEC